MQPHLNSVVHFYQELLNYARLPLLVPHIYCDLVGLNLHQQVIFRHRIACALAQACDAERVPTPGAAASAASLSAATTLDTSNAAYEAQLRSRSFGASELGPVRI